MVQMISAVLQFPLHMGVDPRVQRSSNSSAFTSNRAPIPPERDFSVWHPPSARARLRLSMSSCRSCPRSAARVRQHRPHPHHGCAAGTTRLSAQQSSCHRRPETGKTWRCLRLVRGMLVTSRSESECAPDWGCSRPEMMFSQRDFRTPSAQKPA